MRKALDAMTAHAAYLSRPSWMCSTFAIDGWRVATDGAGLLIVRDAAALADDPEDPPDEVPHGPRALAAELAASTGLVHVGPLLGLLEVQPCRFCHDVTVVQCDACGSSGECRCLTCRVGFPISRGLQAPACPACMAGWSMCPCNGADDAVRILGVDFAARVLRRVLRHANPTARWSLLVGSEALAEDFCPIMITGDGWAFALMPLHDIHGRAPLDLVVDEWALPSDVLLAARQTRLKVDAYIAASKPRHTDAVAVHQALGRAFNEATQAEVAGEPPCARCRHERASHLVTAGDICVGCPCPGYVPGEAPKSAEEVP